MPHFRGPNIVIPPDQYETRSDGRIHVTAAPKDWPPSLPRRRPCVFRVQLRRYVGGSILGRSSGEVPSLCRGAAREARQSWCQRAGGSFDDDVAGAHNFAMQRMRCAHR